MEFTFYRLYVEVVLHQACEYGVDMVSMVFQGGMSTCKPECH